MTIVWILIPVAVVAIAIAVLPVLIGSVHQDRSVKQGDAPTTRRAAREANRQHSRLGRRTRRVPDDLTQSSDTGGSATTHH